MRQKLLKFYQKNKDSILDITNGVAEIPKKKDLKKDNIKELANEGIKDLISNWYLESDVPLKITIWIANASANLRDANDAQDTLNNTSGGDSSSSTSSDSDDSEEEKD